MNNLFDEEFPPNEKSLGFDKYTWKNYSKMPLFTEYKQFPKQGKLGNCYWVSPLVAVYALYPEQIKNLFIEHDDNFTTVRLCVDGEWLYVRVDHYFPFNEKKQFAAFCKPINGGIWAMVLEKAWAKLYGCYKHIQGGYNRSTLKNLTGAPTNKYRTKDPYFDVLIKHVFQNKFPLCCNSKKVQENKEFSKNHAYSLIYLDENIVRVRNPWGLKNQDIKELSLQEFKDRFASVELCYFYQDYIYKSIRVDSQNEQTYFQIQIKKSGQYFFCINQRNKRWFRNQKHLKYKISPAELILINENQIVLNRMQHQHNKELWINWEFDQCCEVYVICRIEWNNHEAYNWIFSVYGPECDVNQLHQQPLYSLQQRDIVPKFIQRDYDQEQEIEKNIQLIQEQQQQQQGEMKERQCYNGKWFGMDQCTIY